MARKRSIGPQRSPVLKDMQYVYLTENPVEDSIPQKPLREMKTNDFKGFLSLLKKYEDEFKAEKKEHEAAHEARLSANKGKDMPGERELRIQEEIDRLLDEFQEFRAKKAQQKEMVP